MIPMARQGGGGGYTQEGTDRGAPRLQLSMGERKVQPGREYHVIILCARWWVGDIDVIELVLPASHLLIFRDRAKVELSPDTVRRIRSKGLGRK